MLSLEKPFCMIALDSLNHWRNEDSFCLFHLAKRVIALGGYATLSVLGVIEGVVRIVFGAFLFFLSPLEVLFGIELKKRFWYQLESTGFASLIAGMASANYLLETLFLSKVDSIV